MLEDVLGVDVGLDSVDEGVGVKVLVGRTVVEVLVVVCLTHSVTTPVVVQISKPESVSQVLVTSTCSSGGQVEGGRFRQVVKTYSFTMHSSSSYVISVLVWRRYSEGSQ